MANPEGEIDHALSEYAIETQNAYFVISRIFEFRMISSAWELWERFGGVGEAFGGIEGRPGGFWECQEAYGEKSFF